MTKNIKYSCLKNKSFSTKRKKIHSIVCGVIIIATLLAVSFSLALALSSAPATDSIAGGTDMYPAPTYSAASGTQFNLSVAYAYVGPAPLNTSYYDQGFNATMYLASQYPSVVLLNITRLSGIQIPSCDAEIEVYGVKIMTNTGISENYAYGVGTNYNASFSHSNKIALVPYVNDLVDHNQYRAITGIFDFNWTAGTSVLSHTIGSIGWYTTNPNSGTGLYSAGIPNTISVTVYRIGYITMSNGSVSVYKDPEINNIASVQLGNYGNGFLYNKLVPIAKLPQTDLFHPGTGP